MSLPSGRIATRARATRAGSAGFATRSRDGPAESPGRTHARNPPQRTSAHGPQREETGSETSASTTATERASGSGDDRRRAPALTSTVGGPGVAVHGVGVAAASGAAPRARASRSVGAIVSAYESQARSRSGKPDVLRKMDSLDPDDALPRDLRREAARRLLEERQGRHVRDGRCFAPRCSGRGSAGARRPDEERHAERGKVAARSGGREPARVRRTSEDEDDGARPVPRDRRERRDGGRIREAGRRKDSGREGVGEEVEEAALRPVEVLGTRED